MLLKRQQPDKPAAATNKLCSIRTRNGLYTEFGIDLIIGRFIVDFYCASAKLVIEVDGSQHYESQGMAYDAERSVFLSALGLEVLRFSNRDIARDFRGVCEQIDLTIQNRPQCPLSHLR